MRLLLTIAILLAGTLILRAAPAEPGSFARGNALYAEGKFADAAASYEVVVKRGEFSANLFYNLADAYYRTGDRGRAILNYQRALLLEPHHTEAAANLAFVRGHPSVPAADEGFGSRLDVDAWTWVAAGNGWLAVTALGAAVWRRRARWLFLMLGLIGVAVGATAGWALYELDGGAKNPKRAVVLLDDARVLYSPADNSKAVSVLPAGGEVRVLSEQGVWDYVQLGDGARGWMTADRIEKVVPPPARKNAG